MVAKRKPEAPKVPRRQPATTPEAREHQMVALAVDVAEQQLRDKTASAQVIVHYLKMATQREALERDKLRLEAELLQARTESLGSSKKIEELYGEAMKAFKTYRGEEPDEL